ncbi:MAG TPA: ATP-binding cassette domain-containing protein [Bacillota bacterium]|nr:ATP-binding cassette domain-containing protein [Bacillota bacterium]
MLQLKEITKRFRGDFTLNRISLQLDKGIHLLIGPNGAGKSTLLRIIATVMRPDDGAIFTGQQDAFADLFRYKLNLGYLPQTFGFYEQMTGKQFLRYIAGLKGMEPRWGRQRVEEVSRLLNLTPFYNEKLTDWSFGQRQRLGLAQALLNDPALLILDEPFCGLSHEETGNVAGVLADLAQNKVILVSTHLMVDLPIAQLLFLVGGCLKYSGSVTQFLGRAEGKVWSVEVAKAEWLKLQGVYPEGMTVFEGDRCRWRIVSERKPDFPEAKAVVPTMEEAYSYWLRS